MKKFISISLVTLFIAAISITFTGCSTTGESTAIVANTISNVFNSALTVAANILAADGTQQLAISAAESYIASVVNDPAQLETINQIIESAIPELANGIASSVTTITTKDMSKKAKTEAIAQTYIKSDAFKKLVDDCVNKYNK